MEYTEERKVLAVHHSFILFYCSWKLLLHVIKIFTTTIINTTTIATNWGCCTHRLEWLRLWDLRPNRNRLSGGCEHCSLSSRPPSLRPVPTLYKSSQRWIYALTSNKHIPIAIFSSILDTSLPRKTHFSHLPWKSRHHNPRISLFFFHPTINPNKNIENILPIANQVPDIDPKSSF